MAYVRQHIPCLKQNYPNILVEEDVLYVDEGNIITSAGSAAGIDACLHLVRRDMGSKIANDVARRLVTPPHRDGGQAQFVPTPIPRNHGNSIGMAMNWARSHLENPITLSDMSASVNMSDRTFLRKFKESAGITPIAWLQRERMFRAQELLETFRVSFKRIIGTSPAAYHARFGSNDTIIAE